ncbi:MAG: hypothetical protein HUU16_03005 [Candidatus Omnitrophica bacterium]|nr:hypothetical protein [Candidatus Omnitrophota bacterium]
MTVRQEFLFENVIHSESRARRIRGGYGPTDLLASFEPSGLEPGEGPTRDPREYPLSSDHRDALNEVYELYRLPTKGFRLEANYYRYSGLTHTVRARGDRLSIRISHHFERQPQEVIKAIGNVLIRKLLRLPVRRKETSLCREAEARLAETLARREQQRAKEHEPTRHCRPPQGRVYDLEAMARELSERHFGGSFPMIPVYWSAKRAKRYWGKYYPDPPRIVINAKLDRPKVPRYVVEAVLYHEMLHHSIGVRTVCGRKRAHTREFRAAERQFPHYTSAEAFLMNYR